MYDIIIYFTLIIYFHDIVYIRVIDTCTKIILPKLNGFSHWKMMWASIFDPTHGLSKTQMAPFHSSLEHLTFCLKFK